MVLFQVTGGSDIEVIKYHYRECGKIYFRVITLNLRI